MTRHGESIDPLLGTLLDVRTVFDSDSALTCTLREALDGPTSRTAVAWVALPEPDGGIVIEHVLGQSTDSLPRLDIRSGQGLTGRVFERARVHWVEEYVDSESITHEFDAIIDAERICRMIAAPLSVGDSVLGVLSVGRRDIGSFGDEMIARVEQLAYRASVALTIAKTARDNAAAAALAERRRVSEELHDGIGALLFSLASRTERLQRRVTRSDIAEEITMLADQLSQVNSIVRSMISEWHTSASTDTQAEVQGIVEDFERRSGVRATALFLGNVPALDIARMQAVTRFVGVALSNVERHSAARRVTVTVSGLPDQLAVAVSNDGPAPVNLVPGVGLGGAEERIARVGGTFTHVSEDDETGFTVRVRIPL